MSESGQDAWDGLWQQLTRRGHAAFDAHDLATARQCHHAALAEADGLFALAGTHDMAALLAPMTYTIAAYNLAVVYQAQDNPQAMDDALWRPIARLLREAEANQTISILTVNCLRHWPRAVAHRCALVGAGIETGVGQRFNQRFEALVSAVSTRSHVRMMRQGPRVCCTEQWFSAMPVGQVYSRALG